MGLFDIKVKYSEKRKRIHRNDFPDTEPVGYTESVKEGVIGLSAIIFCAITACAAFTLLIAWPVVFFIANWHA